MNKIPAPISWPDAAPGPWPEPTPTTKTAVADTRPFAVPFELLEQARREEIAAEPAPVAVAVDVNVNVAADVDAVAASPFDDVPGAPTFRGTPSQGFGVASTGKFGLNDFLGNTGDVLLLGDPLDIAETAVIRTTRSSEDGPVEQSTTSICIGRDIERMLGPQTVLRVNPARPKVEVSPFEEFVLSALDGVSPIERVCQRSGLSMGDLRIALALLADKEQLVVAAPAASSSTSKPPASERPTPVTDSPWDVPSQGSMPEPILVSRTFAPITVLRRVAGADPTGLSALEQFVWSKIDGVNTVQELREVTRLSESDVALALELMQRRGLVERSAALPRTAAPAPPTPPAPRPPPASSSTTTTLAPPPRTPPPARPPSTPPTPAPTPAPTRLEALLAEAARKEDRGDGAGAVEALQQAVRLEPRNGALHNRLGIALVRQHNLPAGLASLNTALALSPHDPTIVSNHARIASLAAQLKKKR